MNHTQVLIHGFYEVSKKIALDDLHELLHLDNISPEEMSFYATMYNFFLQQKQSD